MKAVKIVAAVLVLAILPVLTACGSGQNENTASGNEEFRIVTSFYPMYLLTRGVTGDTPGVSVTDMAPRATGCLHDYQLTPADMRTLGGADVLVINGAGMESFMEKVAEGMPEMKVITASQGIELLKDEYGEENPHVWVSVSGAIAEVENIRDGLCEADPKNSGAYRQNADIFITKLDELQKEMHEKLDGVTKKDIITFHEAFPYFAEEFGLNVAAVIESEPGAVPSAEELARVISLVKDKGITALFVELQYPKGTAEVIARETGAELYTLDPAVTGPEGATADEYIRIMEENLATLEEALK
ncbi:MAG: metal ABC transporter substrate-binding protein [Bacillota bacterium]|nr:metal ABC transporter substrate-binding protein [Bacillota bacterium]